MHNDLSAKFSKLILSQKIVLRTNALLLLKLHTSKMHQSFATVVQRYQFFYVHD